MTPESTIDLFRQGIYITVVIVSLVVLPGLIVGLFVAMFQAATQINEMSLSFIPKLMVTLIVLMIAAPYIANLVVGFTQNLYEQIPLIIG